MSTSTPHAMNGPWHRQLWPWLLMLPPLFSVVGGVTMIYLATTTPSALVVEDYTRIEELTQQQFERDRRARELGLSATLTFSGTASRAELTLVAPEAFTKPDVLRLRLSHATNPDADRVLELVNLGSHYAVPAALPKGRYRIELMPEDRSWRIARATAQLAGQLVLEPTTHAAGADGR